MRISKLDIKGFGCFSNRIFEPGKGVNLIYGPNEAGKSTLLAFIRAMFYGLRGGRRSRENGLPPLRKYEPWQDSLFAGVLEYELNDGKKYRVGRNFLKASTHIHNEHTEDISRNFLIDKETGPLFAAEHLGLHEYAFDQTLYAGQMKMMPDIQGRKHLLDRLLHIQDVNHTESTYKNAENALQEAILERVGSERSSVRPLDKIRQRIKELQLEITTVKVQQQNASKLAVQLLETNHKLKGMEEKISRCLVNRAARKKEIEDTELYMKWRQLEDSKEKLKRIEQSEKDINHEKKLLNESLIHREPIAQITQLEIAHFPFLLARRRELVNTLKNLAEDKTVKEQEYEVLCNKVPKEDVWKDAVYVDHTLEEYLSMREISGNADVRMQIAKDAKVIRPKWILTLIFLIVGITLTIGFIAVFVNRNGLDIFVNGVTNKLNVSFYYGLFGSVALSFASALLLLIQRVRHNKEISGTNQKKEAQRADVKKDTSQVPYQVESDKNKVLRFEEARKEFDSMLKKTGYNNIQDFLQAKRKIDFILRSVEDTHSTLEKLSTRIEQANKEQAGIEDKITMLSNYADLLTEKDDMLEEKISEEKFIQLFQRCISEYQEDCQEKVRIDQKLKGLDAEKNSIGKTIQDFKNKGIDTEKLYEKNIDVEKLYENSIYGEKLDENGITGEKSYEVLINLSAEVEVKKQQYESSQNEMEQLTDEMSEIKMQKAILDARMERIPTGEQYQKLIEEMDRLENREIALISYGESLQIALDALRLSAKKMKEGIFPEMSKNAGNILASITDGHYQKLGANQQMNIQLEVPNSEKMPSVHELSGGTADQVWLSMRLAAIELIEKENEPLPLFLDEPFAHYDEIRTKATMQWLHDFASERQIFLFSCHQRDLTLAQEIFKEQLTVIRL